MSAMSDWSFASTSVGGSFSSLRMVAKPSATSLQIGARRASMSTGEGVDVDQVGRAGPCRASSERES